jgi:hypothetical protein
MRILTEYEWRYQTIKIYQFNQYNLNEKLMFRLNVASISMNYPMNNEKINRLCQRMSYFSDV